MPSFGQYFFFLRHPFRSHQKWAQAAYEGAALTIPDAFLVSWIFVIMQGFYSLIFFALSAPKFQALALGVFPALGEVMAKASWVFIVGGVLFAYPVLTLITVIFLRAVLQFGMTLFGVSPPSRWSLDQVIAGYLCGNAFLALPLVGSLAKAVAGAFYFYAGLKYNLKLGRPEIFACFLLPCMFFTGLIMTALVAMGFILA